MSGWVVGRQRWFRLTCQPNARREATRTTARPCSGRRLRRFDIPGIAWVWLAGVLPLLPALIHGAGIYDIVPPDNIITQNIPYLNLAWREIHHGHLPLWNPYSVLGLPLSFNFYGATLSPTALVGYLFPLHLDFPAELISTLIIAGTGIYAFCLVLGVGPLMRVCRYHLRIEWPDHGLAGVFGGGNHGLKWMALCRLHPSAEGPPTRTRHSHLRRRTGFDSLLEPGRNPSTARWALVLFVVVVLLIRARRYGVRSIGRTLGHLALAGVAGLLLASPLLLPTLQVIPTFMAGRIPDTARSALPISSLFYITNGNSDCAYLGLICVVMAVVGARFWLRRPEGVALIVITVACASALVPIVVTVLNHLSAREDVHWSRVALPLSFGVAVLGGIGVDVLVATSGRLTVLRWTGASFAAGIGVLAYSCLALATSRKPERWRKPRRLRGARQRWCLA